MPEKTFVDTLRDIRHGDVIADLTLNLRDLVAAVRATAAPGELSLTIKVKPASKGDVTTLLLLDVVKVKLPRTELGSTILFATEDNGLQRHDPRQPELRGLRTAADVVPMDQRSRAAGEGGDA